MVGTSNTSTSTGSIGYYARAIADAGLIAFCFAQSPEVRDATTRYRAERVCWRRIRRFVPYNIVDKIEGLLHCKFHCCAIAALVGWCVDCVVSSFPRRRVGLDNSSLRVS